ncbi:hypothetical protein CEXT_433031 [Caerostris extrusa]|uniref:Uncharacterized protein n=1 Tax=Caerostris extrusa TaxID=172846 RepID=A0AAV4SDT0_CAEEX|nr:hypothetical protein CEXT_433031 [Caerostris extrusa]
MRSVTFGSVNTLVFYPLFGKTKRGFRKISEKKSTAEVPFPRIRLRTKQRRADFFFCHPVPLRSRLETRTKLNPNFWCRTFFFIPVLQPPPICLGLAKGSGPTS